QLFAAIDVADGPLHVQVCKERQVCPQPLVRPRVEQDKRAYVVHVLHEPAERLLVLLAHAALVSLSPKRQWAAENATHHHTTDRHRQDNTPYGFGEPPDSLHCHGTPHVSGTE